VNQLDAATLDDDLHRLLWVGLERICRFGLQRFLHTYQAEIKALLRLLIFWQTVWNHVPTPGMELQNLLLTGTGAFRSRERRHRSLTRQQRVLYGVLTISIPWVAERIKSHMLEWQWIHFSRGSIRKMVYKLVYSLEQTWDALSVVHFLWFLSGGKYRSLVERLLRIRVAYVNPRAHRALSFEFMNQYLVWRTVARFLLFAIPLIDFGGILLSIRSALGLQERESGSGLGENADECRICQISPVTVPVRSEPCGHVFCYTCIRSLRMENFSATCPACGVRLVGERRLTYGQHPHSQSESESQSQSESE